MEGLCCGYCMGRVLLPDPSEVGRIMLRFRPIAPKPAAAPGPVPEGGDVEGCVRRKRGGAGDGGTGRRRRRRDATGECKGASSSSLGPAAGREGVVAPRARRAVASVVVVEEVGEAGWEGLGEGCGEGEARRRLEVEAWPAFVTDGEGRAVRWSNGAYKRMVGGGDDVVVVVVAAAGEAARLPAGRGFSCRVRLRYPGVRSATAYCDVWRLREGGLAWRVDVDTALLLGR